MKIATWNLEGATRHRGARSRYVRDRIAEVSADVWILTETYPNFMPGQGYESRATSTVGAYRSHGCWVAIWTRAGITGQAYPMTEETDRAAGVLLCYGDLAPLWVFGTVLPWRGDTRHADLRGGAAFEHALRAQARQWASARVQNPGFEFCVAGDFNQEVGARAWVGSRRGSEALDSVMSESGLRCVTGGSADPLRALGYRASIDHVLFSSGLRVSQPINVWPMSAELPTIAPDHYGVSVTVEVS